jgi:hypothetical protein
MGVFVPRAFITASIALALMSVPFLTTSASGQSPAAPPASTVETPTPQSQQSDIDAVRTENAEIRELLRRMEEQQRVLLEQVDRLQRERDGGAATDVPVIGQAVVPPTAPEAVAQPANAAPNTPPVTVPGVTPSQASAATPQTSTDRYRDGMVIWETPADAKVPFLLKFNINTQLRYLNTQDSDTTFTDHQGVTREVHSRNDITVNRAMFILGGYIFDQRARYSFTVWTSAGAASIIVASNIGWTFNKAITITGGYTGVPGSRSLVNTFPFFTSTDRSMADNFFRPGFTQGVWASGEPGKALSYLAFVGNGLNTLSISANKIDTHLLFSGSVWWEPLGAYGEPGKARNMYDDYYASNTVRMRLGTAFTRSREDRFSNLDQSSPENTSLYNSDGVLTFSTGAFAPGVTVDQATYRMWATDAGIKWNGLAINAQYFMRWLDDFDADGPLPLASTFDRGGELSAGYFVRPKTVMAYGRGSWVHGQFGDSSEYGAGVKWHYLPTERLWFNTELFHVNRAPYSGAFTPYTAGMTGWVPMIQTVLAF